MNLPEIGILHCFAIGLITCPIGCVLMEYFSGKNRLAIAKAGNESIERLAREAFERGVRFTVNATHLKVGCVEDTDSGDEWKTGRGDSK